MQIDFKEFRKFIRFFIVGGSTFLLQTFLYYIFSRQLLSALPNLSVYILALAYAVLYNYYLHRVWTFGDQDSAPGSAGRYLIVAAVCFVLNSALFYLKS